MVIRAISILLVLMHTFLKWLTFLADSTLIASGSTDRQIKVIFCYVIKDIELFKLFTKNLSQFASTCLLYISFSYGSLFAMSLVFKSDSIALISPHLNYVFFTKSQSLPLANTQTLVGHEGSVSSLSFTGSVVCMLDHANGIRQIYHLIEHNCIFNYLLFIDLFYQLVSLGSDGFVRLWACGHDLIYK